MAKGTLFYIDKDGAEIHILTKNSAELVKYDNAGTDTTVADFLANISAGSAASADFAEEAEKDSAGNVISTTYAPIDSPNFTGTPTAPTVTDLDLDNNQVATVGYVKNQVKKLTGVVPAELDTFEELYNAMGQDSDLSTTIATKIAAKQNSDTTLTAIAELPLTANQTFYTTGSKNFAATDFKAGGREIVSKATAREIRKALGIYKNLIFDECEKNWTYVGSPTVADGVLTLNGSSYARSGTMITLGGNPFTIELKAKANVAGTSGTLPFFSAYSDDSNFINLGVNSDLPRLFWKYDSTTIIGVNGAKNIVNNAQRLAITYDGSTIKYFADGKLVHSLTKTLAAKSYRLYLGAIFLPTENTFSYCNCTVDEFRLSNSCRYTENYEPEERFSVDENTVSLLHFD